MDFWTWWPNFSAFRFLRAISYVDLFIYLFMILFIYFVQLVGY